MLEASTYRSYARNIRLHVLPSIGGILLQQLTPLDLTAMYRTLLESGRRVPAAPTRAHDPEVGALIDDLRATGTTWQAIADQVAEAFPDEAGITRHAVAALHRRRRTGPAQGETSPGLSPRTVLYIHSIVRAALRDAARWNRVVRNVADAATPPPAGETRRSRRTTWTAAQLGAFFDFVAEDRYLAP